MSRARTFFRRSRMGTLGALVAAVSLSACIQEQPTEPFSPLIPPAPPDNPRIVSAAWRMDVFRHTRLIKITPPTQGLDEKDLQVLGDYFGIAPGSPDLSILAGDAVEVIPDPDSWFVSSLGEFIPDKLRVRFDVAIRNKLTGVRIVTPTFPAPAAGTPAGVILFPFEIVVTETPGGPSNGGGGVDVIVDLPNEGLVAPSVDWDINPFNFFNDTGCDPTSNDCYRSEVFTSAGAPNIEGGATSEARNIGFDLDPTVSQFAVKMILAGDLEDATPNEPPTAEAGGPYSGGLGQNVTLAASSTDPDPGASATYQWDFDLDGQYDDATGANASYPCSTGGTHTIELLVTDNRGATDTDQADVTCSDQPPTADAGGPYTGTVGSNVTLNGSGTDDGTIVSFDWDLSDPLDGVYETPGASPSYACTTEGTFNVELQVTDDASPTAQTGTDATTVDCIAAPDGFANARWVDASGNPISTATVGQTVYLEVDVNVDPAALMSQIQAAVNYDETLLLATVDPGTGNIGTDLNCNPSAQATCPSGSTTGNIDGIGNYSDTFSGVGANTGIIAFLNFGPTGRTGIQGVAKIPFEVTAAGTVNASVSDVSAFNVGVPITVVVNAIAALQIN